VITTLDAARLSLFAVVGTAKALDCWMNAVLAALLGSISAVGGSVRAVLLNTSHLCCGSRSTPSSPSPARRWRSPRRRARGQPEQPRRRQAPVVVPALSLGCRSVALTRGDTLVG
jgi:Glycine transporter